MPDVAPVMRTVFFTAALVRAPEPSSPVAVLTA
jgi:hypothetical protein